jgi:hypothetical protein
MEMRFAFFLNIRRDRYIVDAKNRKKFQGGFDYPLPVDCNWSFRQFAEVIGVHILGVCIMKWSSGTTMEEVNG